MTSGSGGAPELGGAPGVGGSSDSGGGAAPVKPTGPTGVRPSLESILPNYFGFGYSRYSKTRNWPLMVKTSHGINWNFMYWYQLVAADDTVLPGRLKEADAVGAIPILTHYQLLDRTLNLRKSRGEPGRKEGETEWDVVIDGVQNPTLMRGYFDNVESLMKKAAEYGRPLIFQTEPDSTTWLRQYHTKETWDASAGVVAVASSGHPDLSDLPNTIAGYAQALVRLRDLYAPKNVYMGLCEFDNEDGWNPERSVSFIKSLGVDFDVLFTHHIVKYETKKEGWWDAFSATKQARFVKWVKTITEGTGLKYIHWQTVVGAADHGLMPNYPTEERISELVAAGSIGNLYDVYTLEGPPHSQPWHGYSSSPPPTHPAYNSLDKLAERLGAYYKSPVPLR